VPSAELDALNQATAPRIYISSGGGGDGCGCPLGAGSTSKAAGGGGSGAVTVAAPVNIGPVTAVVLTGTTGDAVDAWLADNGFAIPAAGQPLVAAYAGAGRYFIAIRRNDSAAAGAASSVGVHFTLPGAARALPLRFAQLGAAPEVAFTVFVAAPAVVAPSDPFAALTLADLDAETLRTSGYALSVANAIAAHGGRAFVIEGSYATAALAGRIGPGVESLFEAGATLTRLTAILPSSGLTEDVTFDGTFSGATPAVRTVTSEPPPPGSPGTGIGMAAALALAALGLRRRAGS
jgi:MYXO-CTERM domain-containing protein